LQFHNLQTLYFLSLSSVFDFVPVFVPVGGLSSIDPIYINIFAKEFF
jgi:hypothetical protein